MQPWPDTRDTLLARIRDPDDQQAWQEFVQIYEPLIYRVATRRGLQDADARDVTQRILWAVARAAERWKPGHTHGRFRGWLVKCTSNAVVNSLEREHCQRASGQSSVLVLLEQTAEDSELTGVWQHERRLHLFRVAAERVRPRFSEGGWQAFWRTAVEGAACEEVAGQLGKSLGAVYAARCRVMLQIRQEVKRIEDSESYA